MTRNNPLFLITAFFCGLYFLYQGWDMSAIGNPVVNHWMIIPAIVTYLLSFASILAAVMCREEHIPRLRRIFLAAILGTIMFRFQVMKDTGWQGYSTDSIAFTHYAAELLIEGKNPYTQSMRPTYTRFNIPPSYITLRYDGTTEDRITYPALNFMIVAPSVKGGLTDIRYLILIVYCAVLFSLYYYCRADYALLTVTALCFFMHIISLLAKGNTDPLWLLLILFCVPYFHRPVLAGVLMGAACSIKQTPWALLPFMLIEYYKSYPLKQSARFVAAVGLTFLVINFPFMLHDFHSWFDAVTAPFLGGQIMYGRGLNLLSQSSFLGGGKTIYTVLLALVVLGLMFLQIRLKERSRMVFWFFPAICLYVSYRSLPYYYCFWFVPLGLQWFLDDRYSVT